MKITSISYISIDNNKELIKFTRENLFSRSYECLIGSERYKRIGKVLSSMKELGKLTFNIETEIGNNNTIIFIGY